MSGQGEPQENTLWSHFSVSLWRFSYKHRCHLISGPIGINSNPPGHLLSATQLQRVSADVHRLVLAHSHSFIFIWRGSFQLILKSKQGLRKHGEFSFVRISLGFMICNWLINTCKVLITWLVVISWLLGWDAGNKGWIHLVNNAVSDKEQPNVQLDMLP